MKNEIMYNPGTLDYQNRIKYSAEKLYKNQKRLLGKRLTWENITVNYMKFELPANPLNEKYWVDYRSLWIHHINLYFSENSYECALFVEYNKGVQLQTGNAAIRAIFIKNMKRIIHSFDNGKERMLLLLNNFKNSKSHKKIILGLYNFYKEGLFSLAAKIDYENGISSIEKSELKKVVQKCLSTSTEEVEETNNN